MMNPEETEDDPIDKVPEGLEERLDDGNDDRTGSPAQVPVHGSGR